MDANETEEPVSFSVPPATREEMARAIAQVAWKHKLMKQLAPDSCSPVMFEIETPDEPVQPFIIGPAQ